MVLEEKFEYVERSRVRKKRLVIFRDSTFWISQLKCINCGKRNTIMQEYDEIKGIRIPKKKFFGKNAKSTNFKKWNPISYYCRSCGAKSKSDNAYEISDNSFPDSTMLKYGFFEMLRIADRFTTR